MTDQRPKGDEKEDAPRNPSPPQERSGEKEPHPSKGAGRRGNVQLPPDEQRGEPDPKRKSPTQ
jgi:hypothetical protein